MRKFGKYIAFNVMWLAFSGVEPTPSHYKYNKTFHSAADFPQENLEVAIEANRCCARGFIIKVKGKTSNHSNNLCNYLQSFLIRLTLVIYFFERIYYNQSHF